MRGNTVPIEVELKRGKVAKTIALYQYDYGQKLIFTNVDLPPYYEVHFSNEMHGEAITSIGDETGVEIPDDFLATGLPVYLWLFLHAGSSDGETEYQGVIPVIKRASISDQEPTPTQQTAIEQAIEALNAAIESSDASDSEAWAIGKRGTQDVSSDDETYQNNSKYYAGQASASATSAGGSATSAGTDALKAEGYAVGKQNGTDVTSGSAYYQNNAKYYATQAGDSATSASGSASAADDSAEDAEAYAVGKRDGVDVTSDDPAYENNAKYYAGEAADAALEATTAAASASAAYGTALLAPNYSSSSTYAVGDHVIYSGNYYECNTAITSGEAWTAAHWTQLTVGGETSALKSAVDELESTAVKSVNDIEPDENGNVEIEIADPSEIHSAVEDWLDDHPEATTTVEDGSLTEAKFTDQTLAKLKNDYVTPQMYGAKADGVTDDTQAIQDALDSDYNVHFPDGTYMTSGVTLSKTKQVSFGNAKLKANTLYQDHVVEVTNQVYFNGNLFIEGDSKALVGIKFSNSYGSIIDRLTLQHCLAWGVIALQGHMTFNFIYTASCGTKMELNVSYDTDYTVTINSVLTDKIEKLLSESYAVNMFAYDKSDPVYEDPFVTGAPIMRKFASYDTETGKLVCADATQNKIPNDYVSKECCVCYGGGVLINASSQMKINILDTRTGTTGITFYSTYGHYIGVYYSQGDQIPIVNSNYCLGHFIGSMTAENSHSLSKIVSFGYDYSVLGVKSTGYDFNYNSIQVRSIRNASAQSDNSVLLSSLRSSRPTLITVGNAYLSEQSSGTIIFINKNTLTLQIVDTLQNMYGRNQWGIRTVYFMPSSEKSDSITISLDSDLVTAGYSIDGGTNGAITFSRPSPSSWFKVDIVLFGKVFYLMLKELEKGVTGGRIITVDSALSSTSENPVQNKVIYSAIGDIETLLAGI